MSESRFSLRSVVIGIVLTAVLAIGFTLAVGAQDPDDGEPAGQASGASVQNFEEELVGVHEQVQVGDVSADGEPGGPAGPAGVPNPANEEELFGGSRAPGMAQFFKRWSANVFVPYNSTMTYNYGGSGCTYRTGGSSFSEHTVQLPQGAEIDYLRVYYKDSDAANNASAILFSFDGAGGNNNIASATSSGSSGYGNTGSGFFSHIVDNVNEALALRLNYESATTDNLEICGVRIRYQYTITNVSLPSVLNLASP